MLPDRLSRGTGIHVAASAYLTKDAVHFVNELFCLASGICTCWCTACWCWMSDGVHCGCLEDLLLSGVGEATAILTKDACLSEDLFDDARLELVAGSKPSSCLRSRAQHQGLGGISVAARDEDDDDLCISCISKFGVTGRVQASVSFLSLCLWSFSFFSVCFHRPICDLSLSALRSCSLAFLLSIHYCYSTSFFVLSARLSLPSLAWLFVFWQCHQCVCCSFVFLCLFLHHIWRRAFLVSARKHLLWHLLAILLFLFLCCIVA